MRKAIDELAAENLVMRRQGKGTFVSTHHEERAHFRFLKLVPDEGVLLRLGKAKSRQGGEVRLRLTEIDLSERSRTDRIELLQKTAQQLGGQGRCAGGDGAC